MHLVVCNKHKPSHAMLHDWLAGKPVLRRSSKWPAARAAHLKIEPACQWCGGTEMPEVHHMLPVHVRPDLELDPKNYITLCEAKNMRCHLEKGHRGNWHDFEPKIRAICAAHNQSTKVA